MHAREMQANNIACYLLDLQERNDLPIVIHGKAYKPDVDMLEGSYSLLIGHYLERHGAHYLYCDPLTDDPVQDDTAAIVFLAHNRQITYGYTGELPQQQLYFMPGHGSIIVDPWRTYTNENTNIQVIHYGNTRPNS
jgi:UDPglucose 6-dehydrogenase